MHSIQATPTEYLPIKPLGLGGFEVESLGSYFARMAKAHSVSISVLRNHLALWWVRHSVDSHFPNVPHSGVVISGFNETTRALVEVLCNATSCMELNRTTLLALQPAASRAAMGFVRKHRAWCPACMHETLTRGDAFYDRLLWALPPVERCTTHRLRLELECPHCESTQSWYHHKGDTTLCWKCKQIMLPPIASWKPALRPYLGEADCIDLIDQIGQGALAVRKDAFQVFAKGLRRTLSEFRISPKNSMYGTVGYKHSRREQDRPGFRMMLQQCLSLGVPLTHILAEPENAARSTGLLVFAKIAVVPRHAPRYPESKRTEVNARLTDELAKPPEVGLPPLSLIATELGVSQGFLAYRFAELVAQYQKRRRAWKEGQVVQAHQRARQAINDGLLNQYPSVRFPSQDHLVAEICVKSQVSVSVARTELLKALARRRLGQVRQATAITG